MITMSYTAEEFDYVSLGFTLGAETIDWPAYMRDGLGEVGLHVEEDGTLHGSGQQGPIGVVRFLEVGEAMTLAPGLGEAPRCPWLRGPYGGLGIQAWMDLAETELPAVLVFHGMGRIVRVRDGEHRDPIVRRRLRLDGLLSRFGFKDGGVFLGEYPDYMEYVRLACEQRIEAAGWQCHVGLAPSHNPLRLSEHKLWRADGRRCNDVDAVLAALEVEIWGFATELVEDRGFF